MSSRFFGRPPSPPGVLSPRRSVSIYRSVSANHRFVGSARLIAALTLGSRVLGVVREIAYSHFERQVELPDVLAETELRTDYRDGMLFVHVLSAGQHAGQER